MCCCYDAPQPDFHSARVVTARQRHRCCECLAFIQPGERYEYVSGLWEGELSTYKTCLACVELRTKLSEHCGCWVYEGIAEDICESYHRHERPPHLQWWLDLRDIHYELYQRERDARRTADCLPPTPQ